MIGDSEEGCDLGVARDALIDVTVRDGVYHADARLGVLGWIRLSPWGRGHADSVEARCFAELRGPELSKAGRRYSGRFSAGPAIR